MNLQTQYSALLGDPELAKQTWPALLSDGQVAFADGSVVTIYPDGGLEFQSGIAELDLMTVEHQTGLDRESAVKLILQGTVRSASARYVLYDRDNLFGYLVTRARLQ